MSMFTMYYLSPKQERQFKRLAERVKRHCTEPYTVNVSFVPRHDIIPGNISLLARSSLAFSRLVRMAKRIKPDLKVNMEHGYGWHYLDRTPYHFADFCYFSDHA